MESELLFCGIASYDGGQEGEHIGVGVVETYRIRTVPHDIFFAKILFEQSLYEATKLGFNFDLS